MKTLVEKQAGVSRQISRTVENLKKLGQANISQGTIEARLENIDEKWKKFQDNHETMETQATKEDLNLAYFAEDFFSTTEESYLTQNAILLDGLRQFTSRVNSNSTKSSESNSETVRRITLPPVDTPKFGGDYSKWINFRDLFKSIVIDSKIAPIEQMHHLKTNLTDEAAAVIASLPPTGENFAVAWETLNSRYNNNRLLTTAQIANLFSIQAMKSESSVDLKLVYNGTVNALGALKALGRNVDGYDDLLVYTLVQKLDKTTRREWEKSIGSTKEPPTYESFKTFLEGHLCSLEAWENTAKPRENSNAAKGANSKASHHSRKSTSSSASSNVKSHVSTSSNPTRKCALCQESHLLLFCERFREKSADDRKAFVLNKNLCLNCLGVHFVRDCTSSKTCQKCSGKHHTMIHDTYGSSKTSKPTEAHQSIEKPSSSTASQVTTLNAKTTRTTTTRVLLATALLHVSAQSGEKVLVRALIDQGSEATFVSESLAQRLKLPRSSASVIVTGIGASAATTSRGIIALRISSRLNENFTCRVNAFVIPKLTAYKPPSMIKTSEWTHLSSLSLADPEVLSTRPIELLLGADVYAQLIVDGVQRGCANSPIAQNTQFGWIISGRIALPDSSRLTTTCMSVALDTSLSSSLQRFWEQEEMTPVPLSLLPEDVECEQHFLSTHSRDEEGRYIVRLPLKKPIANLGDSFVSARSMLLRMERRFSRDPVFYNAYSAFMTDYENLHHMEQVPKQELNSTSCYYLPHHGVIRESSATTKLRVVFNGSQKTTTGVSLNKHLHVGPKLLPELVNILLRWRMHKIVFSADMEKMYRQILLHKDDRDLQRILWRTDSSSAISEYRLNTVTYGLTCAPFLAIRVIRQLAQDEKEPFPIGAEALISDVYVDDVLSGADNISEALIKQHEIIELLKVGGFALRKWTSNSPALLDHLTPENVASATSIVWQSETFHMLGLSWQSSSDTFVFHLQHASSQLSLTKRNVLSKIAQLFDPLGWLAPVTIVAKIFMQSLWLRKLEWDENLPAEEARQWNNFYSDLPAISLCHVPRWLKIKSNHQDIQLHGFSDASERAYAAVLYLRVNTDEETSIDIITAKTKVAPVKQVSLPRLELCAAHLLTKLAKSTLETLALNCQVYLWSDSTVTLAWIHNHPTKWKTYVANRVADIQLMLPNAIWQHIDTKDNPADCASRGVLASELHAHPLWWNGPQWLKNEALHWASPAPRAPKNLPEERSSSHLATTEIEEPIELLTRYSRLTKLLRITAWCLRTLPVNAQKRAECSTLSTSEIEDALLRLIAIEQRRHYKTDIRILQSNTTISKGTLLSLSPFLDEKGILRVGGRLKNAPLHYDAKHQFIIPRDSPLSKLLIEQCHYQTFHGGVQLTLYTLRQRYWLIGGRAAVKATIHRCLTCARFRATTATQLMGNLPTSRVTQARPFLDSGVDYAGPISLRTMKRRGHKSYKAYIAVFVCFTTRAVHLEVVSDYTTDGFLAAFRRFVSRRGKCATLTSDNGTNFIGADNELRALFTATSMESKKIATALASDGTSWKFNPPSAPHFGGLWEAAVKSVKHHLRRVIGETTLTFEEMATLLAQIEACLNSRPLQAISDDPEDFSALTPAHFLIGEPLTAVPEPLLEGVPISRLTRWQLIQQMQQHFWSRWSEEYLHQLQTRTKWQQSKPCLQIGDLVLIKNELLPPTKWPLARVIEVHPGNDGKIRVVTVRTATSSYTRPIVKLCVLPKADEDHQN